jgi:hypothetical protein
LRPALMAGIESMDIGRGESGLSSYGPVDFPDSF